MKIVRKMPARVDLGNPMQSTMAHAMHVRDQFECGELRHAKTARIVMGFQLPKWQRPLVWSRAQQIAFIESAWRGIPLGTYSYNLIYDKPALDYLLIDGQQRMHAIEEYLDDKFPVFGWKWSQISEADQRQWDMTTAFPCYVTKTADENYLREYYNLMNFGGTPHKPSERA